MLIGVPKEIKTHEYRVGLTPASVRELVLHGHQVHVEAGAGAGIGIGVTFALGRVVRAAGGAGSMFDPTASAFVVPAVVIFIVGAIATWMPARRASRIDPLVILRSGE